MGADFVPYRILAKIFAVKIAVTSAFWGPERKRNASAPNGTSRRRSPTNAATRRRSRRLISRQKRPSEMGKARRSGLFCVFSQSCKLCEKKPPHSKRIAAVCACGYRIAQARAICSRFEKKPKSCNPAMSAVIASAFHRRLSRPEIRFRFCTPCNRTDFPRPMSDRPRRSALPGWRRLCWKNARGCNERPER